MRKLVRRPYTPKISLSHFIAEKIAERKKPPIYYIWFESGYAQQGVYLSERQDRNDARVGIVVLQYIKTTLEWLIHREIFEV